MKKTLLGASLLSATMAVQAADADQATSLSSVIVTATRTSITTDEALSSVSVITRADIDRLQPAATPKAPPFSISGAKQHGTYRIHRPRH